MWRILGILLCAATLSCKNTSTKHSAGAPPTTASAQATAVGTPAFDRDLPRSTATLSPGPASTAGAATARETATASGDGSAARSSRIRCKEWVAGDIGVSDMQDNDGCQCSNMPASSWDLAACVKEYPCCIHQHIAAVLTAHNEVREECVCSFTEAATCMELAAQLNGEVVSRCPPN